MKSIEPNIFEIEHPNTERYLKLIADSGKLLVEVDGAWILLSKDEVEKMLDFVCKHLE